MHQDNNIEYNTSTDTVSVLDFTINKLTNQINILETKINSMNAIIDKQITTLHNQEYRLRQIETHIAVSKHTQILSLNNLILDINESDTMPFGDLIPDKVESNNDPEINISDDY